MKNNQFFKFKNLIFIITMSFLFITITGCESRFYNKKQIVKSVKKLGDFEDVYFGWRASHISGVSTKSIPVTLVNGDNLPEDKVELKRMAETVARLVAVSLKQEERDKYDELEIRFVVERDEKKTIKYEFDFDMDML